jgi:hypothetical protein
LSLPVMATWAYTKLILQNVADAIEGSMYGWLHEELTGLIAQGDSVSAGIYSLNRAMTDSSARFGTQEGDVATTPEMRGAAMALDSMKTRLQRDLYNAAQFWQHTRIDALRQRYAKAGIDIAQALQPGYPADGVLDGGSSFLSALADACRDQDEIIVAMLHDAGFMSGEAAERKVKSLREQRRIAQGGQDWKESTDGQGAGSQAGPEDEPSENAAHDALAVLVEQGFMTPEKADENWKAVAGGN